MRSALLPLAALALLAGCKEKAPAPAPSEAPAALYSPPPIVMPPLPENARAAIDPNGTYTSGKATLVLGPGQRAQMITASGKVRKGKWTWYADGRRIITTADKTIWAVGQGGLYKLPGRDTPLTALSVDQVWTKTAEPAPAP